MLMQVMEAITEKNKLLEKQQKLKQTDLESFLKRRKTLISRRVSE